MLRVLLVLALVGSSMANNEQEQLAESEPEFDPQQMTGEQRNNDQKPQQTLVILKPTKTTPPPIHCGPNEIISDCVTPCQPTCEFPHQMPCPEFMARTNKPAQQQQLIIIRPVQKPHHHHPSPCSPGCVCAHGFVRSEFGQCIPKSLCPPMCKPHSHFEKCGPKCQPTCELAEPRSLSVCGHHSDVCVSGCFCDAGYVKDMKSGQCVKPKDCTQICPENEHYSDYGVACAPSCQNPTVDKYKCNNYSVELPGCYCNQGYLRDWNTKHCVREYDCPSKHYECPYNEEHYKCKPCTPTCAEPQKKCLQTYTCYPGCDCKKGYLRDSKTGKCVQLCECPQFQGHHPKY